MSQEISLFTTLGPEVDSVGQRLYGLSVPTDKRAGEVNVLKVVVF